MSAYILNPMIWFAVRITGSLVLLAAAIYVYLSFPDTSFRNYLVIALLAFFAGEGPIQSVEKSTEIIENEGYSNNSTRQAAKVLSVIFHGFAVVAGCVFLVLAAVRLIW